MPNYKRFVTDCTCCGGLTTKKHVKEHNGLCRICVRESDARKASGEWAYYGSRNAAILECGYAAVRAEEGY